MSKVFHNHTTTVSLAKKVTISPVFAILLIVSVAISTGCSLLPQKAPAIETIIDPEAQISIWYNGDELPVDWVKVGEVWKKYEPQMRKTFGDEVMDMLSKSGIHAKDFSKIVVTASDIDFTTDFDLKTALNGTEWVAAFDIHGYLPADVISFGINQYSEKSGLKAISNGNWKRFDRIDIHDNISGDYLCSLAVFTSKNTQIRFGKTGKLEQTILHPEKESNLQPQLLIPENQAWMRLEIPAEMKQELRQIEDVLPVDTGALFSGFQSITYSVKLTDYALNSLISLDFNEVESASNAFSILNLANSFAIKPALKRSIGDAKHLIGSIRTERNNNWVQYSCSIDATDVEALKTYLAKTNSSPFAAFALDLIQSQ